jgi:hypothetical protein
MPTTLLEVAGAASITVAGFLIAIPLGFFALGLSLLALGYLLEEVD